MSNIEELKSEIMKLLSEIEVIKEKTRILKLQNLSISKIRESDMKRNLLLSSRYL
jgi:hypothetical protein